MPLNHLFMNVVLIAGFLAIGILLKSRKSTAITGIILSVIIGLLGVGMMKRPDLFLKFLPFTHLYYYSNWFPFAVALFLPCTYAFLDDKKWVKIRCAVLGLILFTFSLADYRAYFRPLATSTQNEIDEDLVCRQSSMSTCSAAALVTFLHRHDIDATEEEMITLADTKDRVGTNHLGLYRAVKLKLAETNRTETPRLLHLNIKELMDRSSPAVVTVGLPKGEDSPEAVEFGRKYNWDIGIFHDVVYLGPDSEREGHVLIADPDFGLESWQASALEYLYQGFALVIEE